MFLVCALQRRILLAVALAQLAAPLVAPPPPPLRLAQVEFLLLYGLLEQAF